MYENFVPYCYDRRCRKVIRHAMFFLLFALLACQPCLAGPRLLPQSVHQQLSRNFTEKEIESLEEILAEAGEKSIPMKHLMPRLLEASVKKVKYEQLAGVLRKKTSSLHEGYVLVREKISRGFLSEGMHEDAGLLSELLDRNLKPEELHFLFDCADRRMTVGEVLALARTLVLLKENGYSPPDSGDIALALCRADTGSHAGLLELLLRYPSAAARDIVVNGLAAKHRVRQLKKQLETSHRGETIKEVMQDRRPER